MMRAASYEFPYTPFRRHRRRARAARLTSAIYAARHAPDPIRSDGYSYYVYLPSWFLDGDTTLDGAGAHVSRTANIRSSPESDAGPAPIAG